MIAKPELSALVCVLDLPMKALLYSLLLALGTAALLPTQVVAGTMQPYLDPDGNSGIAAYELGDDWIIIKFKSGSRFLYNTQSCGAENIAQMKKLAVLGNGLQSYINLKVKKRYAAKLK